MKKLLAIAAAAVAVLTLAPATAEAGHTYQSRVIGNCQHCGKHIYAYYRPIRYSTGIIRYSWVPAYHTGCGSSAHRSVYQSRTYYRPSYNYTPYYRPSYRYIRPGFSISFGSGGFCR